MIAILPLTYEELVEALENTKMDPAHDHLNAELVEDDEPCCICGAVPGTPEYGTAGDGFDGMCPSCADAADVEED